MQNNRQDELDIYYLFPNIPRNSNSDVFLQEINTRMAELRERSLQIVILEKSKGTDQGIGQADAIAKLPEMKALQSEATLLSYAESKFQSNETKQQYDEALEHQRLRTQVTGVYKSQPFLERMQLRHSEYVKDIYGRLNIRVDRERDDILQSLKEELNYINSHQETINKYQIELSDQARSAMQTRQNFVIDAIHVFATDANRSAYDRKWTLEMDKIDRRIYQESERKSAEAQQRIVEGVKGQFEYQRSYHPDLPLDNKNIQNLIQNILPFKFTKKELEQKLSQALRGLDESALTALKEAAREISGRLTAPGLEHVKENVNQLQELAGAFLKARIGNSEALQKQQNLVTEMTQQFAPLKKEIDELLAKQKDSTSGDKRVALIALQDELLQVQKDIQQGKIKSLTEIKHRLASKIDDVAFYSKDQQDKQFTIFKSNVATKAQTILQKHFTGMTPPLQNEDSLVIRQRISSQLQNSHRTYKNTGFISLRHSVDPKDPGYISADVVKTNPQGKEDGNFKLRYAYIQGSGWMSAPDPVTARVHIDDNWVKTHPKEMQDLVQLVTQHKGMKNAKEFQLVLGVERFTTAPILPPAKGKEPSVRHAPAFRSQG